MRRVLVLEIERDVDARILDVLVAQRELVARQRRSAARAVRQNLVPAIEQILVEERLERPPHALDVVVRERDVRMVVVEPVPDARAEPLPLVAIREHALAAAPIELDHAERLDLLLAADAELLLDLDLDRQAVRVPAGLSRHAKSLHRAIAAEQILDRAREHVVNARTSVRRRRAFKEHECRRAGPRVERLLKQMLVFPTRQQLALDVVRRTIGRKQLKARRGGCGHRRSSTPRTSAVRLGSARFATAMIRSTVAGSSASGRHMIGDDRQPQHAHARVNRDDDLGHGRHPDDVGADGAQKAILGARLEIRTGHRDVHTLAQRDAPLGRDVARDGRAAACRTALRDLESAARADRRSGRSADCRRAG